MSVCKQLNKRPARMSQHGFTLVELMVAMLVGLFLTAGIVSVVVNSRDSYRLDESVARMQDDARFAMQELSRDLRMTGYIADSLATGALDLSVNLVAAADCGPAAQPNWILRFEDAVTGDANLLTGVDNATAAVTNNYSCIAGDEIEPGTDVLAIKRFSGSTVATAAVQADTVYVRTTGTQAIVYRAPLVDPFPAAADDNREYRPAIYYIRNFSDQPGDGVPALCRKQITFDAGGTGIETECLARGVEDMQVEYGIDTDATGSANRYLTNPTADELQQVVSVRVFLLGRTLEPDFSSDDPKTYTVSNAPDRVPADEFSRRLYTVTVPTENMRSQNQLRNLL